MLGRICFAMTVGIPCTGFFRNLTEVFMQIVEVFSASDSRTPRDYNAITSVLDQIGLD